jgi:hypothetical protein
MEENYTVLYWHVTSFILVERYRTFGGTFCIHLQGGQNSSRLCNARTQKTISGESSVLNMVGPAIERASCRFLCRMQAMSSGLVVQAYSVQGTE